MTLDELNAIGEAARQRCALEGGSIAAMTRAKTAAIVRALRDEIGSRMKPALDGYSFCPSCGKPIKFTEAK